MTTWLNDFCRFVSRLKNYHPLKSNLTNNLGVKTPESLKSAAAHLQRISGLVSSCHCGVLLYGKFIFSLLKLKVIALSLPFRWDFLLFFLVDIWRNLQGQRKAPDMFFFFLLLFSALFLVLLIGLIITSKHKKAPFLRNCIFFYGTLKVVVAFHYWNSRVDQNGVGNATNVLY